MGPGQLQRRALNGMVKCVCVIDRVEHEAWMRSAAKRDYV